MILVTLLPRITMQDIDVKMNRRLTAQGDLRLDRLAMFGCSFLENQKTNIISCFVKNVHFLSLFQMGFKVFDDNPRFVMF